MNNILKVSLICLSFALGADIGSVECVIQKKKSVMSSIKNLFGPPLGILKEVFQVSGGASEMLLETSCVGVETGNPWDSSYPANRKKKKKPQVASKSYRPQVPPRDNRPPISFLNEPQFCLDNLVIMIDNATKTNVSVQKLEFSQGNCSYYVIIEKCYENFSNEVYNDANRLAEKIVRCACDHFIDKQNISSICFKYKYRKGKSDAPYEMQISRIPVKETSSDDNSKYAKAYRFIMEKNKKPLQSDHAKELKEAIWIIEKMEEKKRLKQEYESLINNKTDNETFFKLPIKTIKQLIKIKQPRL